MRVLLTMHMQEMTPACPVMDMLLKYHARHLSQPLCLLTESVGQCVRFQNELFALARNPLKKSRRQPQYEGFASSPGLSYTQACPCPRP